MENKLDYKTIKQVLNARVWTFYVAIFNDETQPYCKVGYCLTEDLDDSVLNEEGERPDELTTISHLNFMVLKDTEAEFIYRDFSDLLIKAPYYKLDENRLTKFMSSH